jgi:hypothetical protein
MPGEDGVLQPHELAERGLGPTVFGPSPTQNMEVNIVDIDMNRARFGPQTHIVEEDITETLPDGRTIQVATKGAEMPLTRAVELGLVKVSAQVTPAETKVAAPAETKASAKAEAEAEAEEKPAAKAEAKK